MHGFGWYTSASLHQNHSLPYNLIEMWLQINWKFAVALAAAVQPTVIWQSVAVAME